MVYLVIMFSVIIEHIFSGVIDEVDGEDTSLDDFS